MRVSFHQSPLIAGAGYSGRLESKLDEEPPRAGGAAGAELEHRLAATKASSSVAELAGSNSVIVSAGQRAHQGFQSGGGGDLLVPAGMRLSLRYPHQR